MATDSEGIDLGHLADDSEEEKPLPPARSRQVIQKGSLGKDFYATKPRTSQAGKSLSGIGNSLANMRMKPTPPRNEVPMAHVKVKCNYARDRVEVLGDLILKFDKEGICLMPAHLLPALRKIMNSRPGRFSLVQEKTEVPAEVKVEKVAESKPEKKASAPEKKPAAKPIKKSLKEKLLGKKPAKKD